MTEKQAEFITVDEKAIFTGRTTALEPARTDIPPAGVPMEHEPSTSVVITAMNRGYSPEFVEKMMALQERHEANEARKEFFKALADFKSEMPPVTKDKYNSFFKSHYTSLGNLLDTYNPVLGRNGLSLQFPTPVQSDKTMTVECRLSHRMGHTETVSMTGPIDTAAIGKQSGERSRNPMQDLKSTFTYLRSATCEAILGVAGTEGTFNDDGNAARAGDQKFITPEQVTELTKDIAKFPDQGVEFLKWIGAETVDTIYAGAQYKKAVEGLKAIKKGKK
jgi:hypothetical protein